MYQKNIYFIVVVFFQNTSDLSSNHKISSSPHASTPGAVIHKMQHLGQGIYSGRFSGEDIQKNMTKLLCISIK
jgi:hypothetical protein